METSTTDPAQLNALLGGSSLFNVNAIMSALLPYIIILTVISGIITVLYIINVIRKWRVESAIFESRNILREMNERDKGRHAPASSASQTKDS